MPDRHELAERIVWAAWRDLPTEASRLLENIGASQRQVVMRPLGSLVQELRRSAGLAILPERNAQSLNQSVGVWSSELRLVLINAGHPALVDLDESSFEAMLARIAWHEWAHALSVVRASAEDVAAGERLLGLAPEGIVGFIRRAGYRPRDYTHELVAETYALLMSRRRRGQSGQPAWLDDEIYRLVRRVSGWNQ